jgi:hypothetical protein
MCAIKGGHIGLAQMLIIRGAEIDANSYVRTRVFMKPFMAERGQNVSS